MTEYLPTICFDFDGVLNTYNGWKGEDELFEPREGLEDFLKSLKADGFKLIIHSTRSSTHIADWLNKYRLSKYISLVTQTKPIATVYLDDRAIKFNGKFTDSLKEDLENFRAHWEK